MKDAAAVSLEQTFRDATGDAGKCGGVNSGMLKEIFQGSPGDQFHGDKGLLSSEIQFVDSGNVWVVQPGGRLGFFE